MGSEITDAQRIDYLARNLSWECGSYDGPDYLKSAENSNWGLNTVGSILRVTGSEVTLSFREAIDEAIYQEGVMEIGKSAGRKGKGAGMSYATR